MKKILLFLCLLYSKIIFADPIQEIIFFGDSLTDNGNLYHYFKIIPKSPPYYEGRFSNGPTWGEHLGEKYHKQFGTDYEIYATGGATVILRRPKYGALPLDLDEEVKDYLVRRHDTDHSKKLFVYWIGANDYMDILNQSEEDLTTDVVNGIISSINQLIDKGGKNFLVLDIPDISKTPYGQSLDSTGQARLLGLAQLNHSKLQIALDKLKEKFPTKNFILMDTFDIFNNLILHPDIYNKKYNMHLSNTANACWLGGYTIKYQYRLVSSKMLIQKNGMMPNQPSIPSFIAESPALLAAYPAPTANHLDEAPCNNPEDYIFWDSVHPTAVVHQLLANEVFEVLSQNGIEFN